MQPQKITVQGNEITVISAKHNDYISLTDIAKHKEPGRADHIIQNWMRNRNTIEFLGVWERLNNAGFKPLEFEGFKRNAGLNSFVLTPKQWINKVNAVGLVSKPGRYGGTYAHKDIAFEFASWISVEFKLYLIKEFQRLKEDENRRLSLAWDLNRTLSKLNYRIHTDAIKDSLIPPQLNKKQIDAVYACEADILNVALFGKTAAQWRQENPGSKGNIRDFATIEQLVVLSNLESVNSVFIRQGIPQGQRLRLLNLTAISQMRSLSGADLLKRLASKEPAAEYAASGRGA